MNDKTALSVIPMEHFWWHQWCLRGAHVLVWLGFWIAVYYAWRESDLSLLIFPLMLLGIGLLLFRGVAVFMNVWVIWSSYVSHREIRDAEEMKERDGNEEIY